MAADKMMARAPAVPPAAAKPVGASGAASAAPLAGGPASANPVGEAAMPKLVSPSLADDAGGRRLSGAAIVSIAVHGAAAAALFLGLADGAASPPPAAMVVEMAQLPSAPPVPPSEAPPQPEQEEAKPEPVVNKIELPPIPKLAFDVKPAVTVPLKELSDPNKKQAEKPADETTRAAAPSAPKDDKPAAPNFGAPSNAPSNAEMNWQAKVVAAIDRKKRFPAEVQAAGREGVVQLRLTLDRNGRVVDVVLRKSSGIPALDREALSVARRAGPYPKPPKEIPEDPIKLLTRVEFFLKR